MFTEGGRRIFCNDSVLCLSLRLCKNGSHLKKDEKIIDPAWRLWYKGHAWMQRTRAIALGTRVLFWRGGELQLNVRSPDGKVRVQITNPETEPLDGYSFDDCVAFTGDETSWQPTWKDGKSLVCQLENAIRLEVEITNGRIYSIRGDFEPLVAGHCWRFNEDGVIPEPRPGF